MYSFGFVTFTLKLRLGELGKDLFLLSSYLDTQYIPLKRLNSLCFCSLKALQTSPLLGNQDKSTDSFYYQLEELPSEFHKKLDSLSALVPKTAA